MRIAPEALSAIAHKIEREWGGYGYTITGIEQGPHMSALAEVRHSDGSTFYVGSTRWSNTIDAEEKDDATRKLAERAQEDARP